VNFLPSLIQERILYPLEEPYLKKGLSRLAIIIKLNHVTKYMREKEKKRKQREPHTLTSEANI